jgi:hypothetical protein
VDLSVQSKQLSQAQMQEKRRQYQDFVAREELLYWQDFPRNKKFYHAYLRKIYTLFNQCRAPEKLVDDLSEDKQQQKRLAQQRQAYIRDIQLILALCLDLMPQASANFTERIESPQQISSLVHNVWELTDFQAQSVLSNDSKDSRDRDGADCQQQEGSHGENEKEKSNNTASSHGEAILSGGNIMSFIGGLEGLKAQGIDASVDKEARHLRKYLYQNRTKFDSVTEELKMFDADNLKNWLLLGNLTTIMVADVIQVFLSTQENLKVSLGLVEALMTYSGYFSKQFGSLEQHYYEAASPDTRTIFDLHQNQIQLQWAQIFGQLSKLSPVTFDGCLSFVNQALITDHKLKKPHELDDLAEQIFHGRFLHIQPCVVDPSLLQKSEAYQAFIHQQQASQSKKANKVVSLFSEMLNVLSASSTKVHFKIVLLKTLRHLVAQLSFRDPALLKYNKELQLIWQKAVQPVFQFVDRLLSSKVFPGVGSINLNRKVSGNHWDNLLETPYYQHVLLLAIQVIKVSEEAFYQDNLMRLMNWICLPQMLEHKRSFDLACRLLLEIATPELFKVQEFMHWQPKLLNHIFFLKDEDKDFCTPVVAHTDLQVFNQMPHRSPGLLNARTESYGGPAFAKFRLSFPLTFRSIFDSRFLEQPASGKAATRERSPKLLHQQYLDLMAIYDLEFFQETAIPELLLNADKETVLGHELVLLGLSQAAKVLDPALNFRQKYMTVHQQIADGLQDPDYAFTQGSLLDQSLTRLANFVESALTLLIQSPLFHGKAVQDTLDFFQSNQYKDLCSDSMGVLWPSPSLSLVKESEFVAKFLRRHGFAENLVEVNASSVTFEDHVEILGHHFERSEAFDPYAAQAGHANLVAHSDAAQDGLLEGAYQEAVHGRYDDFFVIPNEEYDRANDEESRADGAGLGKHTDRRRPPEYIARDMN